MKAPKKFPRNDSYMSAMQLAWFHVKLTSRLNEILEAIKEIDSKEERQWNGDEADIANHLVEKATEASKADLLYREKAEIERALQKIESGEYGYCEETGEEIGIERLLANPTARLSIEAQERRESSTRWARRTA